MFNKRPLFLRLRTVCSCNQASILCTLSIWTKISFLREWIKLETRHWISFKSSWIVLHLSTVYIWDVRKFWIWFPFCIPTRVVSNRKMRPAIKSKTWFRENLFMLVVLPISAHPFSTFAGNGNVQHEVELYICSSLEFELEHGFENYSWLKWTSAFFCYTSAFQKTVSFKNISGERKQFHFRMTIYTSTTTTLLLFY